MKTEVIIAGFGGQGVLLGGIVLARAAMEESKQTTWFPAYGAEMRGGTANSTVVISDDEIGSPVVTKPSALIALNDLASKKFLTRMKPESIAIINTSLLDPSTVTIPEHVAITTVEATEIADKQLGSIRYANLVALGAYVKSSGIVSLESAKKACTTVLADKQQLIPVNQRALELGYDAAVPLAR